MNPVKNQSLRNYLIISSIFGFLAVAIGAFGAHAIKDMIGLERMATFETGNKYHFYHTFVSFIIIFLIKQGNNSRLLLYAYFSFIFLHYM